MLLFDNLLLVLLIVVLCLLLDLVVVVCSLDCLVLMLLVECDWCVFYVYFLVFVEVFWWVGVVVDVWILVGIDYCSFVCMLVVMVCIGGVLCVGLGGSLVEVLLRGFCVVLLVWECLYC